MYVDNKTTDYSLQWNNNEDLLPDNNLVYQLFPDISEKEQYLTFRRKIFSSHFITNRFVLNQKQDE